MPFALALNVMHSITSPSVAPTLKVNVELVSVYSLVSSNNPFWKIKSCPVIYPTPRAVGVNKVCPLVAVKVSRFIYKSSGIVNPTTLPYISMVNVETALVNVGAPPKSRNWSNDATTWPSLVLITLTCPVPTVVVPVWITCPVEWSRTKPKRPPPIIQKVLIILYFLKE